MINLYAYTYPSAEKKLDNFVLCKFGDSVRDVEIRMAERDNAGANEWEDKTVIGTWPQLKVIKRDYQLHKILTKKGLYHTEGSGTEWFKIPAETTKQAFEYLDSLIEEIEGGKVRVKVVLRQLQEKALDEAMNIISDAYERNQNVATIIAYLCARFGKTIWCLMLFNRIFEKYGNNVLILPAYWLSVHSSFVDELDKFDDFLDMVHVDASSPTAEQEYLSAQRQGLKIILTVSLHGELEEWKNKHSWIADIDSSKKISFADEGDFGTHADSQVSKLEYITNANNGLLVKLYASGTNIQRLAKGSGRADGVIYVAYSQLEKTEDDIVHRKFYMLEVDTLKKEVEELDEKVQPSWVKLNAKPYGNKTFHTKLAQGLAGEDPLHQELNLSNLAGESINCFMLLTSAEKKGMRELKTLYESALPNWHIKVLNGDYTNNRQAQSETTREINEAKLAGKEGTIVIANQMGSRSYSIPEIQATVIAYDRGGVDATVQKVSRCLTPGNTYLDQKKHTGHIVDLSFDPNRSENIERLLVDEIVKVGKSENIDFPSATTFVLSSVDVFKVRYGTAVEVNEEDMFVILKDNENLLRVADVTVDVESALDLIDELSNIKANGKEDKDKKNALDKAKNKVKEGGKKGNNLTDEEKQQLEKIINNAVRALNMSATSVYNLAGLGDCYRDCIDAISQDSESAQEFEELFGVGPDVVDTILDREMLNEPVLDVIVQNSKNTTTSPFF
jgi:hypothetical protein